MYPMMLDMEQPPCSIDAGGTGGAGWGDGGDYWDAMYNLGEEGNNGSTKVIGKAEWLNLFYILRIKDYVLIS